MKSDSIRIANCSGFYGDKLSVARDMIEGGPIDVLTGDYLAELTMTILYNQRLKRGEQHGYVGTFFPAFLFAFAQQFIDSAIAAILNALTPLLTIIFGLLFFRIDILKKQYFGVGLGLAMLNTKKATI